MEQVTRVDAASNEDMTTRSQQVTRTPYAGPSTQHCAECGISDEESTLESDDQSQFYCSACWELYYATLVAAAESIMEEMASSPPAPPSVSASYPDYSLESLLVEEDDSYPTSTELDVAVVVPIMDYCRECGTSATESKLETDDDDEQYYCTDCWEAHYNALIAASESAVQEDVDPVLSPSPPASPPASMARSDSMPSLIDDDEWVMEENISVVVPSTQCCVECGASERETKLVLDDDKEYYCTDCWDDFLSTDSDGLLAVAEGLGLPD